MKASLIAYANSPAFAPEMELSADLLGELLATGPKPEAQTRLHRYHSSAASMPASIRWVGR
jgi:hypothetical protein